MTARSDRNLGSYPPGEPQSHAMGARREWEEKAEELVECLNHDCKHLREAAVIAMTEQSWDLPRWQVTYYLASEHPEIRQAAIPLARPGEAAFGSIYLTRPLPCCCNGWCC